MTQQVGRKFATGHSENMNECVRELENLFHTYPNLVAFQACTKSDLSCIERYCTILAENVKVLYDIRVVVLSHQNGVELKNLRNLITHAPCQVTYESLWWFYRHSFPSIAT